MAAYPWMLATSREWLIWRQARGGRGHLGVPDGPVKSSSSIDLPWPYNINEGGVPAEYDPFKFDNLGEWPHARSRAYELATNDYASRLRLGAKFKLSGDPAGRSLFLRGINVGPMFTASTDVIQRRGVFYLTPPIEMFCYIEQLTDAPEFWIQPSIFEETGIVFRCRNVTHLIVTSSAQSFGFGRGWKGELARESAEVVDFVSVAIDAFLQRGSPDPRFLDP